MQKMWAVFFGVVLLASFVIWFVAPFYGWWLPDNVSSFGGDVDFLFYIILGFGDAQYDGPAAAPTTATV